MRITNKPKQSGLTLVEILVAMTVGIILMGGVIQIFMSNKQTYRTMESMSRLQENGRFAMTFLGKDIRKADFMGCRSSVPVFIIAETVGTQDAPDLDASLYDDVNGGVKGTDNVTTGTTIGADTLVAGTDTLTLQFGGSCGGRLVGNMAADNANIQISAPNTCNLQQNWPFMISDCETADIARSSSVSNGTTKETVAHANNVNLDNRLSKAYQDDAEIFSLESVTYYVALNANGIPSLFRRDNARNRTEELISDIDDFQVLYGEDTAANDRVADQYVTANNVTDMNNVVSVRIQVRSRSKDDNIALAANTVTYNGANITDRRIRRQFSSTMSIRNRQF